MGFSPTRSVRFSLLLAFTTAALFAACGGGPSPFGGGGLATVPTSTCASGTQWQGGHEGSGEMDPGQDCIACHASGEGPKYTIAGTVFKDMNEKNDCGGVAGVQVVITGADGGVVTLTTNSAGNFYTRANLALPYTAKLLQNGNLRVMAAAQTVGACNSCHTEQGANNAPGRIMAPVP